VAELERRERAGGVDVDGAAAAYMRATAVGGCRHSVGTEVRPRAARARRCPGSQRGRWSSARAAAPAVQAGLRFACVVRMLLTSDRAGVAGAAQSLNVGTELGAQGCLKGDK